MSANIVSAKRKASARKHADRRFVCTCGKVCHGNGGTSSHQRACRQWINALAECKRKLMASQGSTT